EGAERVPGHEARAADGLLLRGHRARDVGDGAVARAVARRDNRRLALGRPGAEARRAGVDVAAQLADVAGAADQLPGLLRLERLRLVLDDDVAVLRLELLGSGRLSGERGDAALARVACGALDDDILTVGHDRSDALSGEGLLHEGLVVDGRRGCAFLCGCRSD